MPLTNGRSASSLMRRVGLLFACRRLVRPVLAWLVLGVSLAAWAQPQRAWLSAAEQAWLAQHPVIRIGVDPKYAPYAFVDEQGQYQGVSADLMRRVEALLGVRMQLVELATWAEVLQAARERRIDLITTASRRPEREAYLAFTREYLQTPLVVMTRAEAPDMASPDELARMKVALVRDYSGSQRVLERHPDVVEFWVDDAVEALAAVADGRAEAYVGVLGVNMYMMRQQGFTNLKVNVGFDLRANAQTIAVRKDWAELAPILDKALARIPAADRVAIDARWLAPLAAPAQAAAWSDETRHWLERTAVVRIGYDQDGLPFSGRDGRGGPQGLLVDMLREVQARVGLRVAWVAGTPAQLAEALRRREIDAVLHRRLAHARDNDTLLTDALYQSSLLLVCRGRDGDCSGRFEDFAGRVVAVRRGSEAHDRARLKPLVRLEDPASDEQALELLRSGGVDAVLGESRSLQRALEGLQPPMNDLRFGPAVSLGVVHYRMAVRSDWPELATVVNRSLAEMDQADRARVRQRWVGTQPEPQGLDPIRVAQVGAAAGLSIAIVVGLLLWSNRRQRREIARRVQVQRELARARDDAETASRHKSEFVARTSHELRTPLNAIVGATRLMRDESLSTAQRRMLGILEGASHSLLRLVDDLLDLARIEAGQMALRAQPIDLHVCLDEALDLVQDAAARKGLSVASSIDPALPRHVEADPGRLCQVLVNLLSNAVKYTGEGEIRLVARVLSRDPECSTVELAVEDTGPGIAPEWHQRVFEPFERGAATRAPAPLHTEGVGLGLGIARQIVRLMGSELKLDSTLGRGSRFHFRLRLPLVPEAGGEPQAPAPGRSPAPEPAPMPPGRALIVEDNEVNMLLARTVLERGGWSVLEAATGAQAMAIAEREAAALDLVLMDAGLPDVDGLELTRRLRAAPAPMATLPVIGLTARALPQERQACLDAGMQDVVLKPWDLQTLWSAIARVRRRPEAAR